MDEKNDEIVYVEGTEIETKFSKGNKFAKMIDEIAQHLEKNQTLYAVIDFANVKQLRNRLNYLQKTVGVSDIYKHLRLIKKMDDDKNVGFFIIWSKEMLKPNMKKSAKKKTPKQTDKTTNEITDPEEMKRKAEQDAQKYKQDAKAYEEKQNQQNKQ